MPHEPGVLIFDESTTKKEAELWAAYSTVTVMQKFEKPFLLRKNECGFGYPKEQQENAEDFSVPHVS